jgi:hypothetical protein
VRKPPRTLDEALEGWSISESLLDRTRDVAESQGARFMVMVIPSADTVAQRSSGPKSSDDEDELDGSDDSGKPGFEDPHGTLAEIIERNRLAALDLLPSLRRADSRSRERLYYRQNAHWTAAGHAVAASELYDYLVENGLTTPR